ncbi:R-spondin-1 [Anolis carolinensis]|uniref:R-spondin 1 n=1 Tax=Anolis carolinensis TaxID=28377 RepID=H9GP38_ANOCA|nr:PREDICTED: R-spondin-1 [Anolis carolinensis]|eukprot:XP_008118101.1 PREDICTED: R-spondin-1 [Anolis carolinensis]
MQTYGPSPAPVALGGRKEGVLGRILPSALPPRAPGGWDVTMQLGPLLLCAVVVFLSRVDLAKNSSSSRAPKGKRQRRISAEMSQGCDKGCDLCSEFNGCLRCCPRLFILLERNDIRQTGICLQSCPSGYFGLRNPDMNKCIKCKIENCEECFSRNFCTKCKEGFHLHKGRCYNCTKDFSAANSTVECNSPAQCEMSEWGPWGPCLKKQKVCGFRKGKEERSRRILQAPSGEESVCPAVTNSRRCTVQRNPCPEGQKNKKDGQGLARKDRGRKEGKESRMGARRRKGQQFQGGTPSTTSPPQ